jgi:hypothetical protein
VATGVRLTVADCDNGDGTGTIPLFNKGGEKIAEVLVDTEDLERLLGGRSWALGSHGYAMRTFKSEGDRAKYGTAQIMHRFIMDCPKGMVVDHINHNKLDNRKSNLRIVTHAENSQNLQPRKVGNAPYRGVAERRRARKDGSVRIKYQASVKVMNKNKFLGYFDTAEEANEVAIAYRREHMVATSD